LFYVIAGLVTVMIMIGSYFFVINNNSPTSSVKASAESGEKINYSQNDKLQQTIVESNVENGKAIVTTLSTLKERRFAKSLKRLLATRNLF